MNRLIQILENQFGIHNTDSLNKLCKSAKLRKYIARQEFLWAGELQQEIPFLLRGALRSYFSNESGLPCTDCLVYQYGQPASSATNFSEFLKPSQVTWQAMVESEVICVPVEAIVEVVQEDGDAARAMHTLIEESLTMHRRMQFLSVHNVKDRYKSFWNEFPELARKLSQARIADCLNISPQVLSNALNK